MPQSTAPSRCPICVSPRPPSRDSEPRFRHCRAGAAALACIQLLVKLGLPRENIWVTDLAGVVYEGRTELMDEDKAFFAQKTDLRKLSEVIDGADIFLGLSAGGVLKSDMVARMAARPIIFALANPNPEILPEDVKAVRDDAIMATGRSDYPNQVNNVLCFPYIFRGALDSGATTITTEMEIAAVHAIAELARADVARALAEDVGAGDLTAALVDASRPARARILARASQASSVPRRSSTPSSRRPHEPHRRARPVGRGRSDLGPSRAELLLGAPPARGDAR